jgi:hypothetical protein
MDLNPALVNSTDYHAFTADEEASIESWENYFSQKYLVVGELVVKGGESIK